MQKSQVVEHYKTQIAVAEALGISPAAVSKWPELIPELQAVKLDRLTGSQLKYDPENYKKNHAA
jgi:transcriptional repressor of cell division inhibition gene dicB